jgi:hypothetical protein
VLKIAGISNGAPNRSSGLCRGGDKPSYPQISKGVTVPPWVKIGILVRRAVQGASVKKLLDNRYEEKTYVG